MSVCGPVSPAAWTAFAMVSIIIEQMDCRSDGAGAVETVLGVESASSVRKRFETSRTCPYVVRIS